MKFVYAKVMGGLGNQMFIYAAAKALSLRIGAELVLDIGAIQRDCVRNFALTSFEIDAPLLQSSKLSSHIRQGLYLLCSKLGPRKTKSRRPQLLLSKQFHVDERFFEVEGSCYLNGYWQSPRYFEGYEAVIREIFDLQRFNSVRLSTLLEKIVNSASVSVHLRRGDYVSSPDNLAVHGLCEMDYYLRGRDLILQCNPDSKFFIFSDDPDVAHEMFGNWPNTVFIQGYSQEEDMFLMSRCQNHIIANSSFSWWSAWLDSNPEKMVVAPRQWFSKAKMLETYIYDLFPDTWILL